MRQHICNTEHRQMLKGILLLTGTLPDRRHIHRENQIEPVGSRQMPVQIDHQPAAVAETELARPVRLRQLRQDSDIGKGLAAVGRKAHRQQQTGGLQKIGLPHQQIHITHAALLRLRVNPLDSPAFQRNHINPAALKSGQQRLHGTVAPQPGGDARIISSSTGTLQNSTPRFNLQPLQLLIQP